MKKLLSYTMTALFATIAVSIAAPDKDTMMAKEKAAWQAFKDKKADDFKKLVSADLVAVYNDGIVNMQQEVDRMAKVDIKSFSFSDFTLTMTNADTVMVSYKAKVEGTAGGKDISGDSNCGSVWQMKDGEWRAIFHTDMPEEKSAAK